MNPRLKSRRPPAMPLWDSRVSPPTVDQTLYYQDIPLAGPLTRPVAVPTHLGPPVICQTVLQPISIPAISSPIFVSPLTRPMIASSAVEEDGDIAGKQRDMVIDMFKLAAWKNGIKIGLTDEKGKQRKNSFEEMARKKGIKVGDLDPYPIVFSLEKSDSDDSDDVRDDSLQDSHEMSLLKSEINKELERSFEEKARKSGIRLGRPGMSLLKSEISKDLEQSFEEKARKSGRPAMESEGEFKKIARQESIKVTTATMESKDELEKIARQNAMRTDDEFEKIARQNGIKVAMAATGTEDEFEKIARKNDIRVTEDAVDSNSCDVFEEIAKRNGIRIGKPGTEINRSFSSFMACIPEFHNMKSFVGPSANDLNFNQKLPRNYPEKGISCHASTQTLENVTVDFHCQTVSVSTNDCAIQVAARKESFENEFNQWMMEEIAAKDPNEATFRDLYEQSRTEQEELSKRLDNELDINVKIQRNHKQLVDKLKQEMMDKSEQIEKLVKDLKTLKKQKETEIKRLTKDNKQKDVEIASLTGNMKSKETDLEKLVYILTSNNEEVESLRRKVATLEETNKELSERIRCSKSLFVTEKDKETTELQTPVKKGSSDEWTLVTGQKSRDKEARRQFLSKDTRVSKIDELSEFESEVLLPQSLESSSIIETRKEVDEDRILPSVHGCLTSFTQTTPVCSMVTTSSSCSDNATVSMLCRSLHPENQVSSTSKSEQGAVVSPLKTQVKQLSKTNSTSESLSIEQYETTGASCSANLPVDDGISSALPTQNGASFQKVASCKSKDVQFPLPFGHMQPPQTCLRELDQDVAAASMITRVTTSYSNTATIGRTLGSEALSSQSLSHDDMATNIPALLTPSSFPQQIVDLSVLSQLNALAGLVPGPLLGHPYPLQPPDTSLGDERKIVEGVTLTNADHRFHPHLHGQYLFTGSNSGNNFAEHPQGLDTKAQCARPPPGIQRNPIHVMVSAPHVGKENKYSSFDKLMDALKKKFPAISKGELMLHLRKAKEICGPEGFRKKQISEVVEKVAEVIRKKECIRVL